MRAAGFLLACLPGGSSQDDVGTADSFFNGFIPLYKQNPTLFPPSGFSIFSFLHIS